MTTLDKISRTQSAHWAEQIQRRQTGQPVERIADGHFKDAPVIRKS